ncbi:MAG: hypothetical protein A3C61_01720 [Candidatus Yanofskybacteria bacterium RIFCSPHIGHO2_02_FULL_39_10]|uniref:Uncharacterized protein n=1 Tax=Candidatus Yanofskybacteria bacterium RIFCSPHIGHO2_02_FULL_39_10 TaxID=1802674 RepID=A0A1F8F8G8_9BACT|nr:MAG: hypothetical protein A3C61_01720 [Candidatus Yanofskybacteria bacterium RIFCSPHIGHO2_02_FULL_39_10]
MLLKKNSVSSSALSRSSFRLDIILWIVLVGLIFAGLLTVVRFNMLDDRRQEASLVLVLGDGEQSRMFRGEIVEGMTVFQALIASSRAGQIKLEYSFDSENKVSIKELNGYKKILNKELAFYLNNSKIITENINKITIKNQDRIEVRSE